MYFKQLSRSQLRDNNVTPSGAVRHREAGEAVKKYLQEDLSWDVLSAPVAQENPVTVQTNVATKHDANKPDLSLIPLEAMFELGKAFGYGAKKYGKWNYANGGLEHTRLLSAALRHIYQHLSGETLDTESGNLHLAHALASIAMCVHGLKHHPEKDDRNNK